jgi:hypothetical protein
MRNLMNKIRIAARHDMVVTLQFFNSLKIKIKGAFRIICLIRKADY